jgi:hypothetical protein
MYFNGANIVPWVTPHLPTVRGQGFLPIVHVQSSRARYQSERTLFEEVLDKSLPRLIPCPAGLPLRMSVAAFRSTHAAALLRRPELQA